MKAKTFILSDNNRGEVPLRVMTFLESIPPECEVKIVVKDYKRNRSLEQNDKLWALLSEISADTGYTKEELKALFMAKFVGYKICIIGCECVEYLQSTTELKVGEMNDLITQIEAWRSSF